jgi:hypothetical protein
MFQFRAIESALSDGLLVLKSLLLAEYVRGFGDAGHMMFALKESVLEATRRRAFPQCPSRQSSVFCFPTIDDARAFDSTVEGNDRKHLYRCEIDITEPFIADTEFVRSANPVAPIAQQVQFLEEQAQRYWHGDQSDRPILELLAPPGTVKITARTDW